jgi:hypothetical protein
MGIRVLKKEEDKIQIELSGNYSLKDLLGTLDFYEMDKTLSEKGLEKAVVQQLAQKINNEWWERNKEWFLKT